MRRTRGWVKVEGEEKRGLSWESAAVVDSIDRGSSTKSLDAG